jgi:hypothetical protein
MNTLVTPKRAKAEMNTNNFNAKTQRRKVAERHGKLASPESFRGWKNVREELRPARDDGKRTHPMSLQDIGGLFPIPATMWLANFQSPCGARRDDGVGFSLTPGFSRVGGRGKKFNRFSGFSCARKTVETVFVHSAF